MLRLGRLRAAAKSSLFRRIAGSALCIAGAALPTAGQTTWYVDGSGSPPGTGTLADPYTSIQFAVNQLTTLDNDTIIVLPGTYVENLDLSTKTLEVRSQQGPAVTIIDGGGTARVVSVINGPGGSKIDGFTIQNGNEGPPAGTGQGGGVYVQNTSFDILNCVIRNNIALDGGGVYFNVNTIGTITNTTIEDNISAVDFMGPVVGDGGGIHSRMAALTVDGCTIQNNTTGNDGGGIYVDGGMFNIANSTIQLNLADSQVNPSGGGGAYLTGIGDLFNCIVKENEAFGPMSTGGGLLWNAIGSIRFCTIEQNGAGDKQNQFFFGTGGGMTGADMVEDTTFLGNVANGDGGGVWTGGGTFVRCTFQQNGAQFGGGLYSAGGTNVSDSRFTQNGGFGTGSSDFGAGIYGAATLTNCELDNNTIVGEGGAAHSATLIGCLLRDNSALAPSFLPALGGAAANCTLTDCEVRDNMTVGFFGPGEDSLGGGLFQCTATGCVIRGNQAQGGGTPGEGGGAFFSTLTRCVLYDNFASLGAGLEGGNVDFCTVYANIGEGVRSATSMKNSIVRANTIQLINTFPTYSNIEGGVFGTGNIDMPEIFWQASAGPDGARDLHFASQSSPGVDSGDPGSPLDPDGSRADMGAFPWDPNYLPMPSNYCVGKPSLTLNCLSSIGTTGTPTLSGPDDFHVTASGVLGNRPGLFFWGFQPASLPFLGGTLCVGPPLRRTPSQFSGGGNGTCNGTFDYLFSQAAMIAGGILPFVQIYGQYWNRDPADPFGSALSDGAYWTTGP